MNEDWSKEEVAQIVQDYFNMFKLELEQQKYNKTAHRSTLTPLLNNRSEGSIEFKHQNISAVLANMGLPYIKGYKPRFNYQKQLLEHEVGKYLEAHRLPLEEDFEQFSEKEVTNAPYQSSNFEYILDTQPESFEVKEREPLYKPIKINYLEREQNNRRLGEEGEKLVIEYEKWRLIKAHKENLANKIEWISKDLGDGTGYDILSKNVNGTDRFMALIVLLK